VPAGAVVREHGITPERLPERLVQDGGCGQVGSSGSGNEQAASNRHELRDSSSALAAHVEPDCWLE
jgi:hypothetical protein